MTTVSINSSGFKVKLDAPPFSKPLPAPVRAAAKQIEQFTGPVEVLRKASEEAAPAAEQKPQRETGYRTFQLIPHASVKNDKIDQFAKVISNSYSDILSRWRGGLHLDDPDRIFFETVIERQSFRTYITTNTHLADTVKSHANTTWKDITLTDAECPMTGVESANSIAYDLRLRRPFYFSLETDRRLQETPLGELAELSRSVSDSDRVIIQFGFQDAEDGWQKTAQTMAKGVELNKTSAMKPARCGFDFVLRLLVTSLDERRRRRLAQGVILALKQLNGDNELIERRVYAWSMKRWLRKLHRRHIQVHIFREKKKQIITDAEIAHFVKLPQRALQEKYPEVIETVTRPEVQLPDELFIPKVPSITIGTVTDRGKERTARYPISAFGDTTQKYVDDAFCLPEFVIGEMGSGKTAEAIHRAHSSIVNGRTAFFFDTADGQAARELHDSLPADYPEQKLIHIDLTNKAWPVMLSWLFNAPSAGGDDELEAEKARETAKMFLKEYVSGMATTEFTDRMEQYLASASRAAGANPLDIELALTSPSFREELLERSEVQEQLDVVSDLLALQDKAKRGTESSSVAGITSRLRILSSDRFRANLFYQQDGAPLEFRKYADNVEGGYGYCVTIYCDKNSFGAKGQEAILTFMLLKILLEAGYSRVDIDQMLRKVFEIEIDEGHRFLKGDLAQQIGQDAAVELRKYRVKLNLFGHSREQLGKLWEAFESGGIQVTLYKSKNIKAFKDMANIIAPLDPEEAWAALGKHEAVVTRKLPSKREVSFICKMAPPPPFVKDRSARRAECARQFGRHWKEVSADIQAKRLMYAEKDRIWHQREAEEAERAKEERKQAKKQKASA